MPYYIRVLGTHDPNIHLDELLNSLHTDGLKAKLAFAEGDQPDNWALLEVANEKGETLAQIERNPVIDGELGQEELNEFREIVKDFEPLSAGNWLIKFFDQVKVIYAFQVLNVAFDNGNFEILSSIRTTIWKKTGGIFQADNEGFSNEDGYHILWQFSDDVSGKWSCAVINSSGQWDNFIMELGDKIQRQEFKHGEVPKNAERL